MGSLFDGHSDKLLLFPETEYYKVTLHFSGY
jgi:hypothetical protein